VDPDLDAAIAAINDPERLRGAQDLVTRAAPGLQRVLNEALVEGGWFDSAHNAAVREAISHEDPQMRLRAVRTLFAEETQLSMLVGVAVGVELARELGLQSSPGPSDPDHTWTEPEPEPEPGPGPGPGPEHED
jgi:hypothetical protein